MLVVGVTFISVGVCFGAERGAIGAGSDAEPLGFGDDGGAPGRAVMFALTLALFRGEDDGLGRHLAFNHEAVFLVAMVFAGGALDVTDPGERGQYGVDERCADGGDADLGTFLRQLLAKKQDQEERQRRQRRHQPGVAVEPGLIADSGSFFGS